MSHLSIVKSAPTDGELIADALWGIAAAITESKPKGTEVVVNAPEPEGKGRPLEAANLEECTEKVRELAKKLSAEPEDVVREPSHYKVDGMECIDFAVKMPFAYGNAFKYVWRYQFKNGLEDLEKAKRYLEIARDQGYEISPELDGQDVGVLRHYWNQAAGGTAEEQRRWLLFNIASGTGVGALLYEVDILIERTEEEAKGRTIVGPTTDINIATGEEWPR